MPEAAEKAPRAPAGPGLYLHIPFCSAICPYCDFAVLTGGPQRRAAFVESMVAEIGLWQQEAARWEAFDTVYFGGGTPSALTAGEIGRLLAAARAALPVAADAWIALEANPEDVDRERLAAWRDLGVAMLSLGVQSFDAAALRFLGRRHTPEQARRSVELALEAGLTVSADLIYGIEGVDGPEGGGRWRRDLEEAAALAPHHLSCYQLTIHEGTPFGFRAARGEMRELPEANQADLFRFTHTFLASRGYDGYEVSNFARAPEHRSRHNRKYWDHTPYLGLGPSAHSFDGTRRWWNERKLPAYQARLAAGARPIAGDERLAPGELALEEVMLTLRTTAGLDLDGFRRRHGIDLLERNRARVGQLAAAGLLAENGGRLMPTLDGLAVADAVARSLDLGV
jgi:putative oxygen-independent coproporphyrinogen III oxidase